MAVREMPQHVAIIMDGNGRWAKQKNMPRFHGHLEGVKRVEDILKASLDLGIKVLTLYTFSTENWNRPQEEVSMLMKTLCSTLEKKAKYLEKEEVRLRVTGQRDGVPKEVLKVFDAVTEATKDNDRLILNLAFNYGGRAEILDGVRSIAGKVKDGILTVDEITEDVFSQSLYTKGLPDPDLLIRTSGEQRISNFLLWQLSYAEFYFVEKFWPEFDGKELEEAIAVYQQRDRRYGKV